MTSKIADFAVENRVVLCETDATDDGMISIDEDVVDPRFWAVIDISTHTLSGV